MNHRGWKYDHIVCQNYSKPHHHRHIYKWMLILLNLCKNKLLFKNEVFSNVSRMVTVTALAGGRKLWSCSAWFSCDYYFWKKVPNSERGNIILMTNLRTFCSWGQTSHSKGCHKDVILLALEIGVSSDVKSVASTIILITGGKKQYRKGIKCTIKVHNYEETGCSSWSREYTSFQDIST